MQSSPMYLHKWNEALVDWVNCLALSSKISDLSELESGLFFSLLLKNVIPSDDLSKIEIDSCDLEAVFSYLEKEFPVYGVEDIKLEGEAKVVYISSLLLLLSVTKGKTPVYYSQLCKDLPYDSQVKIKCFLETCFAAADSLNHAFLKSMVEGDYVPLVEQCQRSPRRVSGVMKTPLKEFLESPRLTDKLSRDLRRLESENEALQLEKMELEDELKIEKEKRGELEENLSKKNEQVVKLREELLEYAQSMDEMKKGDGNAINNQKMGNIESELKEAERYVKILVEERDTISQERSKLKEKQASLLDRIKKLEMRVLESEGTTEELQLSLSRKEHELQEIRTHCCELTEKIQLCSTQHNASLDSDTSMSVVNHIILSPFAEGERLSQAVVDLKLAEVEADNEKLKSQLDVTQEQSQKLHVQLEDVKEKLEKAKIAQEAAMAENTQKQLQLKEQMQEREKLNVSLTEATNKISSLMEKNACLNKNIAELKSKVILLESLSHQSGEKISVLEGELRRKLVIQENTMSQLEKEKQSLTVLESKYEELQHQMSACTSEKEELQVSLRNANESISSLNDEKKLFSCELTELKTKLNIADQSNISLMSECALLKKEMDEKQKVIGNLEKKLHVFEKENQTLKISIADSKNVNDSLSKRLSQEKQRRSEGEGCLQKWVESLEDEMKSVAEMDGIESLIFPQAVSVAEKLDLLVNFFKKYHLSNRNSRVDLESKIALHEKEVQRLQACEQMVVKEKVHYEAQYSAALEKISTLESLAADLETKVKQLNEEFAEETSQMSLALKEKESQAGDLETRVEQLTEELAGKTNQISLSFKEKEELEALEKDKMNLLHSISGKEEEINQLKLKISEDEKKMKSLKCERDDLIVEKNNFLSMVGELRSAIDQVSEEKLTTGIEERHLMDWKYLCGFLEAKIKELTLQKLYPVALDVRSHAPRCKSEVPKGSTEILITSEECLNNVDSIMHRNDVTYTVPEIKDHLNGDEMKLSELVIDADISRQLGLESKFWKVIRSGEMLEMFREKLEEKNRELTSKIAELWEVLPRVQLKCNEVFLNGGPLLGREAELSKELCRLLENMLIRIEKHKASLEQEKMHETHRAVSWVLYGIQSTFECTSSSENAIHSACEKKPASGSPDDQELEVSKSLELLEDKFTHALADVASTASIFKEVENRGSNVEDALEYLKSHVKIEKVMDVVDNKNDSPMDNELKILKASNEEMITARIHLERICRENQDELQKYHIEMEALREKVDSLTSQNTWLRNELEICNIKLRSVRQETMEEIRSEYEKKLERLKLKMESAYREDLENFSQESERCRQLEESCKKYQNLLLERHRNLSDMKSYHKSQQQKMESLKKKIALLEEKLFETQLNFGLGDINHHYSSVTSELNRSQSAENMTTYFARGDHGGLENVKFSSENHLYHPNSSVVSRESGRSNLPSGMGQVFCTEDEEGESFNATFLSDLKEGRCDVPQISANNHRKTLAVLQEQNRQTCSQDYGSQPIHDTPNKRLKELMRRNTLCLPHLKSSYPAETQVQDPRIFPEDNLKGTNSLKAPLLSGNQPRRLSGNVGGDLRRRKDKGQIAYMKPGPPTPGKNRRSSLQGNELPAEQKIQSTPGRILSWFGRRRRSVWDAENIPVTPRTKEKGLSRRLGDKQSHGDS